jgi:hypothetical protein
MTVLAAELDELLAGSDDAAIELAGAAELGATDEGAIDDAATEEGASELGAIDDSAAEDAGAEDAGADEMGRLELLAGLELPPPPPQAVSPSAIREKHKTR